MNILRSFRQEFAHHRQAFLLLGILVLFFLFRFPSLFEPHWYGDEGIYQVVGKSIQEGRNLYQEIWDNKPPVLYLVYAFVGGDLFGAKLASLLAGIATVSAFFLLAKTLYGKGNITYWATALFAFLLGTPLLEGNIANAENFMLLPIILAAVFILTGRHLMLAGFLLSIAFLTKTIAVFDMAAFLTYLVFVQFWKSEKIVEQARQFILDIRPILIGFVVPIIFTTLVFLVKGTFSDFLDATLLQSVTYVSYGNDFFFPHGLLAAKLLLLGSFVGLLFWHRKTFTLFQSFIFLWLAFSLFNAFFAQRPFTHYLLVLVPSFCLLVGEALRSKNFRFTGILTIIFIIAITIKSFWIYEKTPLYYQNFVRFVTSAQSPEEYYTFFDQHVARDYETAEFIKMHTGENEKVFIWGNSAQVYILAGKMPPGRLSVAYHATFYEGAFEETVKAVEATKPKYIVVLSPINGYEKILHGYTQSFVLSKGATIYERAL